MKTAGSEGGLGCTGEYISHQKQVAATQLVVTMRECGTCVSTSSDIFHAKSELAIFQ